jgi:hypothetical protein
MRMTLIYLNLNLPDQCQFQAYGEFDELLTKYLDNSISF